MSRPDIEQSHRHRRLEEAYRVVLSGPDTVRVNALGELAPSRVELLDALQARAVAERDARHGGGRERLTVVTPWRLAGQPLLMAPHGAGKGQWRWLLRCPAAAFSLGAGRLNGICCQVTLSSPFLWRFGHRAAWARAARLLDSWGTRAGLTYQVSELHLCADVAGLGVDQLRPSDFVHRGRVARWRLDDAEILELAEAPAAEEGGNLSGGRPSVEVLARYREQETLAFSQAAPHSATIYNKPREIRLKSRDKLWFADLWRRNGWDGEAPIARVEMRYRRAALHELGCEGVEVTLDRLDALWAYSTREWLRHTTPQDGQDKNRSRWPASPWWQVVQGADFGRPETAPAQRRRAHAFQEEHILATIYGYLESWAAHTAGRRVADDLDLSTVLRAVADRSHAFYATRHSDFQREVLRKRKRIGFPR